MPWLIVRSVVGSNDWSYDRSHDATIDPATDRCTLRLIVPLVFGCHDWSYAWSQDDMSARTIGHRMPRLLVKSVAGCNDRLIVPSVAGRNDWSYIGDWSIPLVARIPTMALAIDILQSFVIARPGVEIDRGMRPLLEIVANIADRSHLCLIATNGTIQKSYDLVWVWLHIIANSDSVGMGVKA